MNRHFFISVAFAMGGIVTLIILLALRTFAKSMAGMSDGASTSSNSSDEIAIFLICAYFFVSAFGLFASKTKYSLWIWALLAHALLASAYAITFISIKSGHSEGYVWRGEVIKLSVVMGVYFLPWLIAWAIALSPNINALRLKIYRKLMQ